MFFFFFKQKTAYELRISDWSSDVCSSDLGRPFRIDHPKIDHRADADGDIVARDHVLCGHVEHHCPQIHADHLLDIGDEKDEAGALDGGEAAEGEYDAALIFAQNLDRRCPEQQNEDERRNVEGQTTEHIQTASRSEARSGGKECVSTCRSGWSPCNEKKKNTDK